MRADRLLQELALLRQHGRLSSTELATRLEVSVRTVLRDMEALSTAGVPVYAERGRLGGFALLPGYQPALQELTEDEISALLLAPSGVSRPPDLHRALQKVSTSLAPNLVEAAERAAQRILIDPSGWSGVQPGPSCFAQVQRAVLSEQRLAINYRPRNATATRQRTVDPYGLLQAGATWYLIAAHRGRPHTFRIDRVETARILDTAAVVPDDVDLRALWHQLRTDFYRPAQLVIEVEILDGRPHEVVLLLSAVGSEQPTIHPGPPMVLSMRTLGLRGAAAALTGFGSRIRVRRPPELVEAIRATAQAALEAHQ